METLSILSLKAENKVLRLGNYPLQQSFRAFMAGVYISLGALFTLVVRNDLSLSPGVSTLLSGLVFSIGLLLVVVYEGELFTGNCLMLVGVLNKRITSKELGYLLAHTLVWNTFGCFITANLAVVAGLDTDIFRTIMTKKVMDVPMINVLGGSIFCNLLVCLAIWASAGTFRKNQEPILIVMPVAMFVSCGFDHSIADIFMAVFCNPAVVPVGATLIFLAIVILGNIIGGFGLSIIMDKSFHQ